MTLQQCPFCGKEFNCRRGSARRWSDESELSEHLLRVQEECKTSRAGCFCGKAIYGSQSLHDHIEQNGGLDLHYQDWLLGVFDG